MQFKVPQFIDIEDKIFGPLTFKQFIYIVGGGALCYIIFQILPIFIAVILIIPVAALAIALAFYKVNGKPFIHTLEASFRYAFQQKLYIWKRERKAESAPAAAAKEAPAAYAAKLSKNKLRDIAWSLDILDAKKITDKK